MEIKRNQLMIRDIKEKFEKKFTVKGKLILDNLIVYGVNKDGFIQESVDFLITRKLGNNIIIPSGDYDKYVLVSEKLEKCDVINICANEFVGEIKAESGDRTIIINSGGDKNG